MDCVTAQKVWNHPNGFIEGVRLHLPGVLECLTEKVGQFVKKVPDPFDSVVKAKSNVEKVFRATHSEGLSPLAMQVHDVVGDQVGRRQLELFFTEKFGTPIRLANICCQGCGVSDGTLSDDDWLRIQLAAVNTDPEKL